MLVLVTYDVSLTDPDGTRRLRRVSKQCQDYGIRVQNSVFECRVDAAQYVRLKHLLEKEIDSEKDSIRFYSLGNHFAGKIDHIGKAEGLSLDKPLIL